MQQITAASQAQNPVVANVQPLVTQFAGLIILGLVILYGVGFANMDIVHSVAHDARHAFAFPCH